MNKLIQIAILAVLFGIIAVQTFAQGKSLRKKTGLEYHQALQKQNNFESAMSRNTYGTLKEAKSIYKEKKRSNSESKKKNRVYAKRDLYLAKARELEGK
jgi:hypothetical protein